MERTRYGDYEYLILEEDVPIWNQNSITNRTQKGYSYIIFYQGDHKIDSEEWYFSAMECEDAVQNHIDRLTVEDHNAKRKSINPHDEAIKKMEPFMQVITDLNIAIDTLVFARQKLVQAMCELSDYPKIIIDSLNKKGEPNG